MKRNNLMKKKWDILFKKWSNKNYSVFRTLNKTIKICTLAVGYTIIAMPQESQAQIDTTTRNDTVFSIDCVVVTAKRAPTVFSESARVVEVIQKDEIQQSPAQSINELLEFALSTDVRQRGSHGVQSDISVRGGSFDQVLVLLNGIPVNDPQTGHHNLNLPIDIENISRIEILEGPGARIFGPNAFSGAVNIITENNSEISAKAGVFYGQNNFINSSVLVNYRIKNITNLLSAGIKKCDGYTDNTDFLIKKVFYQGSYSGKLGKIDIQLGYNNKGFGANSFYTAKYPEQYEELDNKFAALSYSAGKDVPFRVSSYWRRNKDRFELFREDFYSHENGFFVDKNRDTATYYPGIYQDWNYYKGHNYHLTDVVGVISGLRFSTRYGITSFGADFKSEKIMSNVLGELMDTPLTVNGEPRGEYTKTAQRNQLNIYAEQSYSRNRFTISGGGLINITALYGTNYFFGGETGYRLYKKIRIYSSINQSLRFPTFTDLYYNGPTNYGNPELNLEKALNVEAGLKQVDQKSFWNVSLYKRFGTDIIDWVKGPSETKYTTTNYSKTKSTGIELAFKKMFVNFPVASVQFSYSFSEVDNTRKDTLLSAYVLDYLKHKVSLGCSLNLTKKLSMVINSTYQDRNGSYSGVGGLESDYKPFFVVSSKMIYKNSFYQFSIEASNILNTEYRDFGSVIMPGRWIIAGAIFELDLNKN